jgi:hypothetical protein
MKKSWLLIASMCLCLVPVLAGCGGGGSSSAPVVVAPTDPAIIASTTSKKSVSAATSVMDPNGNMNGPTRIGARTMERLAGRIVKTVTTNIDSLEGDVGETYFITYTNEQISGCTVNGSLGGAVTSSTNSGGTLSMAGTLHYTACTDSPNMTVTVTNGSIVVSASGNSAALVMTMPSHYAFTGKTYSSDITFALTINETAQGVSITQLRNTGTDSLGNTFNNTIAYETVTQSSVVWNRPKTYTNRNVIDGTTNNTTCTFNYSMSTISCTGTSAMSNGIVLTYAQGGMVFSFTDSSYVSGTTTVVNYYITGGTVAFTTNTGYTGTLSFDEDSSGTGTLKDATSTTVATLSWTTSGYCTVDYVNASMTDEQFYLTNIQQAMA